jgi:hypothetical protein
VSGHRNDVCLRAVVLAPAVTPAVPPGGTSQSHMLSGVSVCSMVTNVSPCPANAGSEKTAVRVLPSLDLVNCWAVRVPLTAVSARVGGAG